MPAYDLIVIGSGAAGTSAAEAAVNAGAKRVAVIEKRKRLGGECPNRGCIPTKAMLRSTQVLALAREAKTYGLRVPKAEFRFRDIVARKDAIVDRSTGNKRIERILEGLGVDVIKGTARFTGKNEVTVRGERLTARKFVVAVGSKTFIPPIEGIEGSGYLTSDTVWDLKKLPKSMLVIGGGPIGVEFAEIFSALGTKMTVVEFEPQLLPREDPDIASVVQEAFEGRTNLRVMVSSKVTRVSKKGSRVVAEIESADGNGEKKRVEAEALLVATGKRSDLDGLDLDAAGIETDAKGRVVLNDFLRTSHPNVYVAGDAASQMLFTHVAHYQGEIAATNALKGDKRKSDLSVVPRGTFCEPEVGSVGMTEDEAREKGHAVGVGKVPYAALGKASVMDAREGLVKIVVDKKTGAVLGGHIVGHSAAEIVHEVALAMKAGIPYTTIAETIHAFPTFAEGVGAAAASIE